MSSHGHVSGTPPGSSGAGSLCVQKTSNSYSIR